MIPLGFNHAPEVAKVLAASLGLGISCLRPYPRLGLKRILLPVSYWRTAELSYAWARLCRLTAARLLDVGSPKQLPVLLAKHCGFAVVSVDLLDEEVAISRRYAEALGIVGPGPGQVVAEVHDARELPFADASFDAASCISVLEHIPADGDSRAVQELVRVVKPGGLVVLTVPFDRRERDTYVDRDVYERRRRGDGAVFYQRHYDERTLSERLVTPSNAFVDDLEIWGEASVRIESILTRLGGLGSVLSPFEPILSLIFLRQLRPPTSGNPMAAFITLRVSKMSA